MAAGGPGRPTPSGRASGDRHSRVPDPPFPPPEVDLDLGGGDPRTRPAGEERGGRHRAPETDYAWFPTTYDEMEALFLTGRLSRKMRLVPLDVIERVRQQVKSENSAIRRDVNELDSEYEAMRKKIGIDRRGQARNNARIGWRVAAAVGTIPFLMAIAPAAPAAFAGIVFGGTWLVIHQQFLRTWRRQDDERFFKAIRERDTEHWRSPRTKPRKLMQMLSRPFWWGMLLTFSPFAFAAESAIRVTRNAQMRVKKKQFEARRERIEGRITNAKTRIEQEVKTASRSDDFSIPDGVPLSRVAFDNYYYNSQTPPSRVPASGAGDGPPMADVDDPSRRRRLGGSLV